jgi:carboxypeptidase T
MVNNYATVKDTAPLYVGNLSTINTSFDVQRLGLLGDGNFTVRINPISANITAVGNPINYNGLIILQETDGIIQYTLAPTTQIGDDISFELIINNGSFDSTTLINKKFGTLNTIFEDAGDSVTDNFVNNGWDTTMTTFVSPSSSLTESPNGNYPNNANETITLESPVDLTNALGANVTFYAKWEIENNWDYTQFEVSIDNGANWIPQCGNYTNLGSTNNGQPTGEPLYDGTQNDWVLETIDLSDYLGESILVRFQFESDNAFRADGFYFDDLKINILNETLGIQDTETNPFSIYPNPVQNYLNITTALNDYKIEVYSIQGQLISVSFANNGSQTVDYSNYASGMYLMKLTSESAVQTFKIVKE